MMKNASLALITALALGASGTAMADSTTTSSSAPVAAQVETVPAHNAASAPTAPAANSDDAQRYAQRDATHQADKFTGGSVVVIGVSGGALIVVLLLLLILL